MEDDLGFVIEEDS